MLTAQIYKIYSLGNGPGFTIPGYGGGLSLINTVFGGGPFGKAWLLGTHP